MAQNRHLILITLFLAVLLTLFYIYQPVDRTKLTSFNENDQIESSDQIKSTPLKKKPTVCDKVDIHWLASDRQYWDGWTDKAMFLKADGTFTKGNVYITEGDEICIVVLLGPTPAKASIKDETDHVGPRDSITMFAIGENSAKLSIQLQQHHQQANAYFAAAKFQQAETYKLKAISEYRAYFWESPVSHPYRNTTEFTGAWVDTKAYQSAHSQDFFASYENVEDDYAINGKVFIPNDCKLEFRSNGEGAQCLGKKVVHVLGDNNARRNLKALKAGRNWCNLEEIRQITDRAERREKLKCGCNDDTEDPTGELYPWITDKYTPLKITNSLDIDSNIYFNNIGASIVQYQHDILKSIEDFAKNEVIPKADIVIVALGNADVEAIQVSPIQFVSSFKQFLTRLRKELYPNQKIIVKTPQYFCCGSIWSTSWNTGRSLSFTMTVRDTVRYFLDEKMLLWDVHSLGIEDTTCLAFGGSSYSKRNVVNVENLLLWNLICDD
ncbi:unnamed protein product [Mucor hiemalis]